MNNKTYLLCGKNDKIRKEIGMNLALRMLSDMKQPTTLLDETILYTMFEDKGRETFIKNVISHRNRKEREKINAIIALNLQNDDIKILKEYLDIDKEIHLSSSDKTNIKKYKITLNTKENNVIECTNIIYDEIKIL